MVEGQLNEINTLVFLKDLGTRDTSKNGNKNIRRMYEAKCLKCDKIFELRASDFNKTKSCGCYVHNKDTKDTLIEKIKNKYPEHSLNFDTFVFKEGQHTPINFICEIHGVFESTANRLLNTKHSPCPKCSSEIISKAQVGDKESFIAKAFIKYGDKYGYDKVEFKALREDVLIYCNTHRDYFKINANNFLYSVKVGCPECIKDARENTKLEKTEEFLKSLYATHNDTYDLSKVVYRGWKEPIEVVCKEHGSWFPTAGNFGRGSGCPTCSELSKSMRYRDEPTLFYIFKIGDLYKIGITTKSVSERYLGKDLNTKQFEEIEIKFEHLFDTGYPAFRLEQHLRSKYKKFLYKGDSPFRVTGVSELLTIFPDLDYIKEWIANA